MPTRGQEHLGDQVKALLVYEIIVTRTNVTVQSTLIRDRHSLLGDRAIWFLYKYISSLKYHQYKYINLFFCIVDTQNTMKSKKYLVIIIYLQTSHG